MLAFCCVLILTVLAVFPPQLYPSHRLLRYLLGKGRCRCRSGCWDTSRGHQHWHPPRVRLEVSQPAATGGSPWSALKLLHLIRTTMFSLELGFEPKYSPELGSFSLPLLFLIHVVYIFIYIPQESQRQGGTPEPISLPSASAARLLLRSCCC